MVKCMLFGLFPLGWQ